MEQDPHLLDLGEETNGVYQLAAPIREYDAPPPQVDWTEIFQHDKGWKCDASIPGILVCLHSEHAHWPLVVRSTEDLKWNVFAPISSREGETNSIPTTILHQGKYWRVDDISHGTRTGWVYRLLPWPESEPWLNLFELDVAAVRRMRREEKRLRQRHRREQWAWLYEPIVGCLPSHLQLWLAQEFNFDPEQASRRNALLHFYVFFGFTTAGATDLVSFLLGGTPLLAARYVFVLLALALEGLFRWAHVSASNEPCGFFGVEIVDWLIAQTVFIGRNLHRSP